ncbi:succinate dehydrogenase, hydrophobic membrane anchor protein [Parasphingorhabdus halotolerans]|uniref:Succinate dehydrogenase hydrophobic membrane anchor subunit n=1 Tax=Parasphingorhabdus halotolerans TaxID=2725558 RepID=A0A6H2DLR1_9SPHN|nr:succinate dehydrogenase, hydrophobic membrane anchor protein [Parasphingorhabdus halotolerans]QJB68596.1 succinate dehydrogenase, hydrophobic membrane anchor protein [Parasphingorhabdus halotolerans]
MGSGTNIGRVRGLGSAGHGAHHWIIQRVTAIGNLLLVMWLLFSLLRLPNYEHELMVGWLSSPLVAVPMMLMLVSIFWHLRLGLQVLIEDYVPDHGIKFGLIIFLNFFAIGGAALGIFAVAKIAFTGVAV